MRHRLLAASSALVLIVCGAPAAAQVRVQEAIALSDLDLSTARGQAGAKRRIRAAAARLCHQVLSPVLPRAAAEAWRCRRAAVAQADAHLAAAPRSYAARGD